MHVIQARNVNDALPQAMGLMRRHAMGQVVRGASTLELPWPVTTVYSTEHMLHNMANWRDMKLENKLPGELEGEVPA
jgi:hypothetical protein